MQLMKFNKPLLILACALPFIANAQQQIGALETAVKYFEANQASRCTEAFHLYTKGTQENIRAKMHRYERERDGPPSDSTQETMTCDPTKITKRSSIHLLRQNGYEAIVTREYTVGRWLNKFIKYGTYIESSEELRLIRENGAWRVDLPRTPIGRERSKGETLIEVGSVDVSTYPHNRLDQDVVFATKVMRVPRNKIEAVLRDPVALAKLFPYIRTVKVLESTNDVQRLSLVFEGWDRPIIITMNTPREHIDRLRFDAGWNAPIMFTGWWNLSEHHDGTRVDLNFVINKRQWPMGMGDRIQAPERVASVVLDLEKEALKR